MSLANSVLNCNPNTSVPHLPCCLKLGFQKKPFVELWELQDSI